MFDPTTKPTWKGPTIREIAETAGVGTATVDRVLNNRVQVRQKTRRRVIEAIDKLSHEQQVEKPLDIRLFCESGQTFNGQMAAAEATANRVVPGALLRSSYVATDLAEPHVFARQIEEEGAVADGIILVAREHPAYNRAVRKLVSLDVPTVCLTTDLPSSRRSA